MNNDDNRNNEFGNNGDDESLRDRVKDVAGDVHDAAVRAADKARDLAAEAEVLADRAAVRVGHAAEQVSDRARTAYQHATDTPKKRVLLRRLVMVAIALVLGIILGFWMDRDNSSDMSPRYHEGMTEMMMQMSGDLDGLQGRELEKKYLEDMIAHHQGAMDMSAKLLSGKDVNNTELRSLAAEIIRSQSAEVEMMQQWLANY